MPRSCCCNRRRGQSAGSCYHGRREAAEGAGSSFLGEGAMPVEFTSDQTHPEPMWPPHCTLQCRSSEASCLLCRMLYKIKGLFSVLKLSTQLYDVSVAKL
uniref:Uncharacterized protein n=1 Tax=Oryza nivara TaxID=4536 RepID=A0A0E0HEF3_ORYNI